MGKKDASPRRPDESKKPKAKVQPDGSVVRNIMVGGIRKRPVVDVSPLNVWTFGARLSPKVLRSFGNRLELPEEFVRLIAYHDGGHPKKNFFSVRHLRGKTTKHEFTSLLAVTDGSLLSTQELLPEKLSEFVCFGKADGKDSRSYLAFKGEEVWLINLTRESSIFVAENLLEFCQNLTLENESA